MANCSHEWEAWWEARPRNGQRVFAPLRTWVRTCSECQLSELRAIPAGAAPSSADRAIVGRLIPAE
jgi:hypothetical protein